MSASLQEQDSGRSRSRRRPFVVCHEQDAVCDSSSAGAAVGAHQVPLALPSVPRSLALDRLHLTRFALLSLAASIVTITLKSSRGT